MEMHTVAGYLILVQKTYLKIKVPTQEAKTDVHFLVRLLAVGSKCSSVLWVI